MTPYEEGYRDGMEALAIQSRDLNDKLDRLQSLLHKAMFIQPVSSNPRPGINIWLILEGGIVTTGYFMKDYYVADSGVEVYPTHWCLIPPEARNPNPILKVDIQPKLRP